MLSGHGATWVLNDAGQKVTFEWGPGAMFAIPLNTWHQHFNGSGTVAARFVSSTNMPPVINLYEDTEFVFNTSHDFVGRFAGEPDYFAPKDEPQGLLLKTNFVANTVDLPLIRRRTRCGRRAHSLLDGPGSMNSHISQFRTATYKKGHRHGPGAHVIILPRRRLQLMWPEGEEPRRYDWEPGTLTCRRTCGSTSTSTPVHRPIYLAFKHEVVSCATPRVFPRPGSASASAATRSITPTNRWLSERPSPRRSRRTGWCPRWTRLRGRTGGPAAEAGRAGGGGITGMTHDPDHEHDEPDLPLADNPIWQQDNVTLHSVGIDIGSSGTQVAFSPLFLRRRGEDLTRRTSWCAGIRCLSPMCI